MFHTTSEENDYQHILSLSKLQPNTRYYFKVIAKDNNGKFVTSDFYSLNTATVSTPPQIVGGSLILTSGDVLLSESEKDSIVIPRNTPYSFKFRVKSFEQVKLIKAIIRNENVLGINTSTYTAGNTNSIIVTELKP